MTEYIEFNNYNDNTQNIIKKKYVFNDEQKQKNKETFKRYYQRNRDKILKKQQEYRLENKDKILEYKKNHYNEKLKNNRNYLDHQRDKAIQFYHKSKLENPDYLKICNQRRMEHYYKNRVLKKHPITQNE